MAIGQNGSKCRPLTMIDITEEILKSLARGTKTVTSKDSNTTAQQVSCHRANYISSNLNHLLQQIASGGRCAIATPIDAKIDSS